MRPSLPTVPVVLRTALVALALLSAVACDDPPECRNDVDCGAGQVCASGQCEQCASNANCGADEFCCQGTCLPGTEVSTHCGCGTAPAGSGGQTCSTVDDNAICLVGDTPATPANVSQGTCGCGCTTAEGGPLCTVDDAGAPTCTCAENADCRRASAAADGRPHRVADTCTPDSSCVCFSTGTASVCDPDGAAPDCSSNGGCANLIADPANCGVPGRVCTDEATGIDTTGACVNGGCTCNDAADCSATNVNTCAFVATGEDARCVCAAYTADGIQAACPMELECAPNGCILDGTAMPTEESLRSALGLP